MFLKEFEAVGCGVYTCEESGREETREGLAKYGPQDHPWDVVRSEGGDEEWKVGVTGAEVVASEADGVEANDDVEEDGNDEEGEVDHRDVGPGGEYWLR